MLCELADPNSIKQFVDKFRSTWSVKFTFSKIPLHKATFILKYMIWCLCLSNFCHSSRWYRRIAKVLLWLLQHSAAIRQEWNDQNFGSEKRRWVLKSWSIFLYIASQNVQIFFIRIIVTILSIFSRLTDGEMLDVLVNNAGVSPPNSPERTMNPYDEQREISMSVNCIAPILLTDLLLHDLKQTVRKKVRNI